MENPYTLSMFENYLYIGFIHGIITGIIWLIGVIAQLVYSGFRFVNDTAEGATVLFNKINGEWFSDIGMFAVVWGFFGMVMIVIIILVWPLVVPTIIITLFLFGLRGFLRLKKKVEKIKIQRSN